MKKCKSCHREKIESDEFFELRKDTGKYRGVCRECILDRKRELRELNKDAINSRDRDRYASVNKDKISLSTEIKAEKEELLQEGYKRCSRCSGIFGLEYFNKHPQGFAGKQAKCRVCQKKDKKPYTKADTERWNKTRRMKKYGITEDCFSAMFKNQKSSCKICCVDLNRKTAHIDHCHTEGHVRGLLCTQCNTGLGMFKDDTSLLEEAIKYLSYKGIPCKNEKL